MSAQLQAVIRSKNLEEVRKILDGGYNVNTSTIKSSFHGYVTPLHYAIIHGAVDIVRLLLERGADPTLSSSETHVNAIELACWYRNTPIVNILRDRGQQLPTLNWAIWVTGEYNSSNELIDYLIEMGATLEEEEENPDSPRPLSPRQVELKDYTRQKITERRRELSRGVSEVMVKKNMPQGLIGKNVASYLIPSTRGGRRSRLNKKTRRAQRKRTYSKRR